MSADSYLLDTSALLTLFEDEPGAERVEQLLSEGETVIPWVVFLEMHYVTQQECGAVEADRRYATVKQLPAKHLWEMSEPLVLSAARLKALYRVSLADSIVAAYALSENAVLLHKDPEFEALAGKVRQEALPYKTAEIK